MVDFKSWGNSEKLILWVFFTLCILNFIVGILALGPDILSW
jgi:hypothetical protein